jgi:hypothetical protein
MSSKHYDIAIIGGSLSARIAATLLAKQGSKVLFLRYREATASEWFHSSLFLEKLLGTLGGRSCFVTQKPIQVLSEKARVTLNNDLSLAKELSREFGESGSAVSEWLEQLREQGELLENIFWENGGLPWPSFKTTARFKLLCMRRKINWAALDAPITSSFDQLPETATGFVTDLLQGLALKKLNALSRAQAALLWAQAMRPENLKEPDFSDLLSKRFDQFHGLKTQLEELEAIDCNGSRWTGGKLKSGGHFTATTFLLGDTRWVDRFSDGKTNALPLPHHLTKQKTGDLTGQLSLLLATRVICGGEKPLRLAIEESNGQPYGLVLGAGEIPESQLRKQLGPVLPFVDYEFVADENVQRQQTQEETTTLVTPLTDLPLRIGTNLYCADSNALLPEMGAAGAALLGLTLAENLTSKRKQGEG